MNPSLPVVWTSDDISAGKADKLRQNLKFLDRHGIPGVFFIIPRSSGRDLDQDPELLRVIEQARKQGHEFYQHGFEHHAFECGVPDLLTLEVDPKARRRFDAQRAEIEALHTPEAQVEMLENGQRIWRRAFGENSPGFRPGWGAYCENFYKALSILGYRWVSSRFPSMTSFLRSIRPNEPSEFREGISSEPHLLKQGIWEYPIAGDYGYFVRNSTQSMDAAVGLAHEEFAIFAERRHPMVLVSHFFAMEFTGVTSEIATSHPTGTGFAVHDRFIPEWKKSGKAEFIGMKALVARYQPD